MASRVGKPAAIRSRARTGRAAGAPQPAPTLDAALAALKRAGRAQVVAGYARFGIVASRAFGVPMGEIQRIGKALGKHHALARALWASGWYEARLLAAYVAEPGEVTSAEMDAWCAQLDTWATCDTLCFALWDRVPLAWDKIRAWAERDEEYVKRAAFALLASVALHDKRPIEDALVGSLALCERAADDGRNFVKKGVSWALRTIGARDRALHARVIELATRLAASEQPARRWIGKDVLRDLERPLIAQRLAATAAKAKAKAKGKAKAPTAAKALRPSSSPGARAAGRRSR